MFQNCNTQVVLFGLLTICFAACQTPSNQEDNDQDSVLATDTLVGADPNAQIRPNSLPESNLLISLDDLFTESQMKE